MEDRLYGINGSMRRRRRKSSSPEPVTLAVILSALVLVTYLLTICGVVVFLDSQKNSIRNRSLEGDKGIIVLNNPDGDGSKSVDEASTGNEIPRAKWPVSLRDERDDFEIVAHPADSELTLELPRFWSPPIHHNKLMSRETAMKIGSCSVPNEHGDYARGADCPLHQRTIHLNIASYRDFQCRETIESLYLRATYPERIRVGVVDQIVEGVDNKCIEPIRPCFDEPEQALCKYRDSIDAIQLDARMSVGPVPARHIGNRMYRGEYYAAQSDAHVNYTNGWDVSLIVELESTGNEMAVLSTYLRDVKDSIDEKGNPVDAEVRPIMCNSRWDGPEGNMHIHHSVQPMNESPIRGMPQLHPWWSAGFSFSRGHFVVNVPYDLLQPMVFSGEEMSIAIRGYTVGYDFYAPGRSVIFHYYCENEETIAKRKDVPTFWENSNKYKGTGRRAMRRLLGIVHLNPHVDPSTWDHTDEHIYGLGGVRTPERLMKILGIDVANNKMEGHLCRFVNTGRMHEMFVPHLRKDGMGVDYSEIDYEWVDDGSQNDDSQNDDEDEGEEDEGEEEEEEQ